MIEPTWLDTASGPFLRTVFQILLFSHNHPAFPGRAKLSGRPATVDGDQAAGHVAGGRAA
jgi:hypothetical protein